jgi:hypothetical protein
MRTIVAVIFIIVVICSNIIQVSNSDMTPKDKQRIEDLDELDSIQGDF